jgi:hypothetical protein
MKFILSTLTVAAFLGAGKVQAAAPEDAFEWPPVANQTNKVSKMG